jgi:hypothetical protein
MTKAKKAPEVLLYTTAEGASMDIGTLGRATNTHGVPVPEDQVADLTAEKRLSTKPKVVHVAAETDEKASKAAKKEQ